MPYIKRDQDNNIIAIYAEPPFEGAENLPVSSNEIIEFLNKNASDKDALQLLNSSDYELARVLEDLIELLVDKNLILFTELPSAAQHKLTQRRRARHNLHDSDNLMVDENGII